MVNGGLLCVGGLDEVAEVAPKDNPGEVTSKNPRRRKIKPKGLKHSRLSRRQSGKDVVVEDQKVSSDSRNLKSLITKGGKGGRIKVTESNRWEYFPESNNKKSTITLPTIEEREERNKDAFVSVSRVKEENNLISNVKEKVNKTKGTHSICNLNKLEHCMNGNLCCNCHVGIVLKDFIGYCSSIDSKYTKLAELHAKYKYTKKKGEIQVKDTCLGIANDVEISCSCCNAKAVSTAVPSTFQGKNLRGEYTSQKNSNWYQLNLKLVLGTMASGIGPSYMAQILSFLDINYCQSLNGRFKKILR